MGTVTATGTTTGGETGGTICSAYLAPFTGAFTVHATSDTPMPGGAIVNVRVNFIRSSGPTTCVSFLMTLFATGTTASQSWTVGGAGPSWGCLNWDTASLSIDSAMGMPAATWTMEVTGASVIATYCPYGTEANPDAPYNTVITTSVLELVATLALTRLGEEDKIPYVVAGLQMLAGQIMKTVDCTQLPAPNLVTDMTDFNGQHVDALTAWFYNAAWNYFCRCKVAPTGRPTPTPPRPPDVTVPVDVIVNTIPLVCDTEDLCTILNGIVQKLDSLTANVSYARRDIQIMQRQGVPFAYIPGPSFSDLSGSGELAVSDILALSVQSTTVPPTLSLISADPLEYRFLGRLSLGTADGWLRQVMLSHNPHLVLPIEGPVTRIGYSLELGVVATIQAFVGEPIG